MRNNGAFYLLVLEKPSCRPKIYIASGSDSRLDVHVRLTRYNRRSNPPIFVEIAFKNVCSIVCKGIFCWISISIAADRPVLRNLFLALEDTFSFVSWAMQRKITPLGWSKRVNGAAAFLNTMAYAHIAP